MELAPAPEHERAVELFDAVAEGDSEKVSQLLSEGVPAGVVDDDGNTPLHKAAEGETECVKILLHATLSLDGPDINVLERKNGDGDTALMASIRYEDSGIVGLMVNAGARVTAEAVDLARTLDVPEVVSALTKEIVADRVPRERTAEEKARRVSVSATAKDGLEGYTSTFSAEAAAALVPEQPDKD